MVYASLTLLPMPLSDLNSAAALRTARDSVGCCHAHSNCRAHATKQSSSDQQENIARFTFEKTEAETNRARVEEPCT